MSEVSAFVEPARRELVAVVVDRDGALVKEAERTLTSIGLGSAAAVETRGELLEQDAEKDVVVVARVRSGAGRPLRRLLEEARRLDPEATSAVLHGEEPATVDEVLAAILAGQRRVRRRARRRPGDALTRRELDVLRTSVDGASNREIAAKLWVSRETVKYHLANAYRKLGVGNRADAVRVAVARGLLPSLIPGLACADERVAGRGVPGESTRVGGETPHATHPAGAVRP